MSAGKCIDPEKACTLNLTASHRTPPDPLGSRPAAFMGATPDGSTSFFASPEELTKDANTGPDQLPPSLGSADVSAEPPTIQSSIPSIAAGGIATDCQIPLLGRHRQKHDRAGRTERRQPRSRTSSTVPPLSVCPSGKTCPPDEEKEVEAKPQYVAVDDEHIYWTNEGEGEDDEGTIGRADIDGTPESIAASIEVEWITGASRPKGIAVDDKYVYWANAGEGRECLSTRRTIGRAKLDGDPSRTGIYSTGSRP